MKKLFLLLFAIGTTAPLWAYFKSGDLFYEITRDQAPYYEVEVICPYEWDEENYSNLTSAIIPETVIYDDITYSVTSIGYEAFAKCTSLTSITIPESVKWIGTRAFDRCGLTSIVWNVKDFYSDEKPFDNIRSQITSFTFGENVQNIPYDLCSRMENLTSITIPNSVTWIGEGAFYKCSGLTSVTIGNSVTSIGVNAFADCSALTSVSIPNSVTSIKGGAFGRCSGLTSILVEDGNTVYDSRENCNAIIETATNTLIKGCQNTIIPNSVTSIGYDAFGSCSGLTSITIPNSVTSIGEEAFWGCSGLVSITIPNSVTSIGRSAFADCSGLTSITLSNNITEIRNSVFGGCSGLTSVTIPNGVMRIGLAAFSWCTSLTSVSIPNSVLRIEDEAFANCTSLTSITVPESVTKIGKLVFYGCSSLATPVYNAHCFAHLPTTHTGDFVVQGGIKLIAGGAFCECSGLTSITIPNSVTDIGELAFYRCYGLAIITCGNVNPPTLEQDVFFTLNQSKIILYVPIEAVDTYKSTPVWQDFDIEGKNTINSVENNYIPSANTRKLLRNGQLVIVRDGVEYNAQGQIVKE